MKRWTTKLARIWDRISKMSQPRSQISAQRSVTNGEQDLRVTINSTRLKKKRRNLRVIRSMLKWSRTMKRRSANWSQLMIKISRRWNMKTKDKSKITKSALNPNWKSSRSKKTRFKNFWTRVSIKLSMSSKKSLTSKRTRSKRKLTSKKIWLTSSYISLPKISKKLLKTFKLPTKILRNLKKIKIGNDKK